MLYPRRSISQDPVDLFVCPRCSASLDEEAIKLEILGMLYRSGSTMNVFVVYAECDECGAELEAEIDARLQTHNEVFSPLCEDDETESAEMQDSGNYTTFSYTGTDDEPEEDPSD